MFPLLLLWVVPACAEVYACDRSGGDQTQFKPTVSQLPGSFESQLIRTRSGIESLLHWVDDMW